MRTLTKSELQGLDTDTLITEYFRLKALLARFKAEFPQLDETGEPEGRFTETLFSMSRCAQYLIRKGAWEDEFARTGDEAFDGGGHTRPPPSHTV